jgi:hypothetical protein
MIMKYSVDPKVLDLPVPNISDRTWDKYSLH